MNIFNSPVGTIDFILICILILLLVQSCKDKMNLEHDAIRLGYATYDVSGNFTWKDVNERK